MVILLPLPATKGTQTLAKRRVLKIRIYIYLT